MMYASLNKREPVILLVPGWSEGPLFTLRYVLEQQQRLHGQPHHHHQQNHPPARVIEVQNLPMPPFPGRWMWHPHVLGQMVLFVVVCSMIVHYVFVNTSESLLFGGKLVLVILLTLGAYIWIKHCLIVTVLQVSIQQGVGQLQSILQENNVVAILAFSWGGMLVAELLLLAGQRQQQQQQADAASRMTTTDTSSQTIRIPPTLLMAPTTAIVANLSKQQDAALRIKESRISSSLSSSSQCIHVVHGSMDSVFCPHPERWEHTTRINYHLVVDTHVLGQPSTRRLLLQIVQEMQRKI